MLKEKRSYINIFFIIILLVITILTIIITNHNNYANNKIKTIILNKSVTIDVDKINKKNDGKLVIARGYIDYGHKGLSDNLIDINVDSSILLRTPEIYQWEQYEKINKKGKKVYKYRKVWSSEIIDSKKYKNSNYKNPSSKSIEKKLYLADNIKLGKFELSEKQKYKIPCTVRLKLNKNMIINSKYKIYDDYVTTSKDPEHPKIGDTRVSYCYNNWKYVTILAVQSGKTFKPYKFDDNFNINYIKNDIVSVEEIIDSVNKQYNETKKEM